MRDLVAQAVEHGGLPVDDVLALALPLVEQVRAAHEHGRVAPLRGLDSLRVEDHRIGFEPDTESAPMLNPAALRVAEERGSSAIDVRRAPDRVHDFGSGVRSEELVDLDPAGPPRAHFVAGWQRWEHLAGHHDELTDIGSLGELLAGLLCGLDLADHADASRLAGHHRNLFALQPTLHPVVAAAVTSMLDPDRHRRTQDLGDVALRLSTYLDQPEDFDLDRVVALGRARGDRRSAVLTHLRDRLFDLTRRNPLLHFRSTQRTLNLTQASVPLVLDVRSIRPAQLFTWGGPTSERLVAGRVVEVGSVVRWDDAPYAAVSLDALISTARRDRAEYGQDQLRLVPAFLRWHNVKDDPDNAIWSPLVLAPVTLAKQRGVKDSYRLQLVDTVAEVNPVLRHELRELYGFSLPDTVDLRRGEALEELRSLLEDQARVSQPGVSVRMADKPRISLIRSRAHTALQSYRRRRGSAQRAVGRRSYAYSYTRPGWVPLGIQVFRDRLLRQPLPLSVELGDRPAPRQSIVSAASGDDIVESDLFALQSEGETNPYSWEVDLCSVTLANFNYRTLTLVRDYDALLAEPRPQPAFDELFSESPREALDPGQRIELPDRYLVVPADGSQLAALSQARAGDNFVIQGPPGTGKSQTITNLVADYLARGKRVLFVCQKRAALDVVHARLRSQGLDEICTLVHDSQADKKAFVHGLRDTYEKWSADASDPADLEEVRQSLVAELATVLDELAGFERALLTGEPGLRLSDVLDRLVALRDAHWGVELEPGARRLLPDLVLWRSARPAVDRLGEALIRTGWSGTIAASSVRLVDPASLADSRADALVAERAAAAARALAALLRTLGTGPASESLSLADVRAVAEVHALFTPLVATGRHDVLRPRSATSKALRDDAAAHAAAATVLRDTSAAAAGWHQPLGPQDARTALEVAERKERALFRAFSGPWRQVRDLVRASYADPSRQLGVSATEALRLLVAQHDARAALDDLEATATRTWGHADVSALAERVADIRRLDGHRAEWRDLLARPGDEDLRAALDDLPDAIEEIDEAAAGVLLLDGPLPGLATDLATLAAPSGQAQVRAVAPSLTELTAHPEVLAALRLLDAPTDSIEYAVLTATLDERRAVAPVVDRVDGDWLDELVRRVAQLLPRLQRANADVVTARLRARFRSAVELSQRSVSGMNPEDRARKAAWSVGRRELEHEFGKVRAYKSIRQLASEAPGAVVAAMRPVWLMSPASLSDTLPLESTFDVVIYDEASQVPVEEAVPALFRADQVIVVGDRMQLPPTTYFQAAASASAENDADDPDEGSQVGVVLDADSFLAVSSVRLPSTMLLWHYRSRYEALIQFSNAAFYEGRLATAPDRETPHAGRTGLEVSAEDVAADVGVASAVDALLARSISLLRVRDGLYTQRTNPAEAAWIAAMVRELLRRETGLTLGVVAFSEAQQGEIERALERLSGEDPDFAARYEAEVNREEDGQTVGLFVKNLENVQGDERDVILMSVCYAPGADGRMRMNFGPINNAGGEKRLNVIFSRARQHMVLVSSIDHTAITNVYNDGANTLKGFLRYAAAVSDGDVAQVAAVLGSLRERAADVGRTTSSRAPIVDQLADTLTASGLEVARDVGQSGFRCDLAVRRPGAASYSTAVLVDHGSRLDSGLLEERRLTQPGVLTATGWHVEQVTALEWLERPDAVRDRIVASLDA